MTTKNVFGLAQRRKLLLKASVAVPMAALMLTPAAAVEIITVDSPVTVSILNQQIIDAMNLPESDITVEIESDGEVFENGTLELFEQGAGAGDGALVLINRGNIGTLLPDSVDIDSLVNVSVIGSGTFTGTNAGLITGSLFSSMNGDIAVTNSGDVRGGVTLFSGGAVSLGSTGSIGGSVSLAAFSSSTSETVDGVTTEIVTGSAASVSIANAGTKAARGDVSVSGATASAEVTGIAGDVSVNGFGTTTTVDGETAAPTAGKTVTTVDRTVTRTGGVGTGTIGVDGDVLSLSVSGANEATATVAGKVAGTVSVQSGGYFDNLTQVQTVTLNADGDLTGQTFAATFGPTASPATSTAVLASTGSAGDLFVGTTGDAKATVDGTVTGVVDIRSSYFGSSTNSAQTFDGKGNLLSNSFSSTEAPTTGALALAIGASGKAGSVTMISQGGGITADIAGKVAGNVFLAAEDVLSDSSNSQAYDATTLFQTDGASSSSQTLQTGKVVFTVAATGTTGQIDAIGGTDGVTGTIAGTSGNVILRANTGLFDNSNSATFDGETGNFLASESTSVSRNVGGPLSLTVSGKSAFTSLDSGTGANTVTVSGTVGDLQQFANATTTTSKSTESASYDDKGNQIGFAETSSSTSTGTGGAASLTVDATGRVNSYSANADGGVTIVNSGTIVAGVGAQSNRGLTAASASSFSEETAATDTQSVTTTLQSNSSTDIAVGGAVSLVNNATGLIGDPTTSISLNGIGGVTINNDGAIRGGIAASSARSLGANSFAQKTVATTVFGVDGGPDVTTTVRNNTSSSSTTAAGGAIDARFAGVVGTTNFTPATAGNVSLSALGNVKSTVVAGGAIFGSLSQTAGQASSGTVSGGFDDTRVLGTDGKGSYALSQFENQTSVREGASLASATIAGRVGISNAGSSGNVSLTGNTATLAIEGGIIDGSASVTANGRSAFEQKFTRTAAQTTTDFVPSTTAVNETLTNKTVNSGGSASLTLTAGSIGTGTSTVSGVDSATATIAAGTKVANGLSVSAGAFNSEFSRTSTYTRTGGVVASSDVQRSLTTAVVGSASATVAGVVGNTGGSLNVSSSTGNATAAITGRVGNAVTGFTGNVNVNAAGSVSDTTTTDTVAGKLASSGSTSFGGLGLPGLGSSLATGVTVTRTIAQTTTATGGSANVTVETSAADQAAGVTAVNGSVSVGGLASSSASVAAGTIINGSVSVGQVASNSKFNSTETSVGTALGTQRNLTSTTVATAVGGTSTLSNAGKINGTASVNSVTTASLSNSGRANGLSATAVNVDTTTTVVDNRIDSAPARVQTTTTVRTPRLGTATLTNAAGAVAGSVNVAAGTGTLTNGGFITGQTTLGQALDLGTRVVELTDGSSAFTYTAPATRALQTYTMDQNGVARGIRVQGATNTVTNMITGASQTVQTSDIVATINLNSGSITLGDITAQATGTGTRQTDTTVNLRGSGWLGVDLTGTPVQRTPNLTPSAAVTAEFGGIAGSFVRVQGVNLLRKQDAGTFVIAGQNFVAATTTTPANWTLDVGTFAIDAGEIQLARPTGTGTFGIRGNVTNAATLVLGRRVPVNTQPVGDSLVTVGPERILGLTINQTGNFTQTAAGTLVVGATGALTRFSPASVSTGGSASELLGPVTGGVSIPYFTSPTNPALTPAAGSTPSRIDVTGDLNLAGTVRVTVSRDSIYRDGDGTTLATYTGTGTVTATAVSTIASPFVSFSVVNDAATRTVRLVSRRSAYSAAAQGTNAQAAATALQSAIPGITTAILSDATGGAAFGTVRALANAQDVANVVNALDWRLTSAQAAQVFNELSSGEIYASVSAIDQNLVLNRMPAIATTALLTGQPLTSRLWASPVGDFSRFNGDSLAGATGIRSSAYGVAFGGDVAFADDGLFSVGASYGEHDVSARGTPETARIRTWTVGAHITKGFGQAYVQGSIAYGFSRFSVERELSLLARTLGSEFRGTQLDAAIEAGYRFEVGGNWNITPFASAAIRNWETNEAVEADGSVGGGLAVTVAEASKSIFRPSIGARVAGQFGSADGLLFRPLLNVSYTYQGDVGTTRSLRFAGGGDAFTVRGFSPDGFGTVELGVDTVVKEKVNLFLRGGYSFGGGNNAANIRAGLGFNF